MHRDIKPQNIMFDKNGEIKLIDFGISKITEKGRETRTIGTTVYMAPEVSDKNYGKECDVWSLGVTIYQLLTGDLPFNATSKALLKQKIKNGEFEFPAKSNLTKECKDLIKKMLEVDPVDRITVQEALDHPWIKKSEHGQTVQKNMNQKAKFETVEKLQRFKGQSIFKKACLNLLIKHLNNEEIKSLRGEFEKMDTDNSGFLEYNELKDALKQLNIKMNSKEIDSIIHELDFNDNHKVDYTEFLAAQIDLEKFLTIDRLNAIFCTFDTDVSGKITKKNLKDSFTKFGREISDDEIDKIWKKHHVNGDIDANDGITFEEFIRLIIV